MFMYILLGFLSLYSMGFEPAIEFKQICRGRRYCPITAKDEIVIGTGAYRFADFG